MALLKVTPPDTIEFQPDSKGLTIISLTNICQHRVAFKLKTTAPKCYYVRPSGGILEPENVTKISIINQVQNVKNVKKNPNSVQRFLVQATIVSEDMKVLQKDFWSGVQKSDMQEIRLNVKPLPENLLRQGIDSRSFKMLSNTNPSTTARPSISSGMASLSSPVNPTELETKYQELMQYCLGLEKEKSFYTREAETLRQELTKKVCSRCRGDTNSPASNENVEKRSNHKDYELWHIVAILVAAVVLLKLFNYLTS